MEWGKGTYSLSPPFLFTMKKIILFVLCSISAVQLFADGWQGQQGSRRFFLKTDYTVEGTTMTIPEYWIEQAPCDSLSLSGDSLFLRFNNGQLVMKVCLISSPSPRIKASVTLYQKEYRMDFVKADTLQSHYWPQNPVPPYPYVEEEIAVPVNDSIVLSGTLTRPRTRRRVPAVIILSGTGKQDRDASFTGHRPFARIADYLTRRGMAVLRLDDRGVGKSTGRYEEATTADFASDALRAVAVLKQNRHIRSSKIGLMGHSEGGAAAMMAAAASDDVAFVVSLAGLMTDGLTSLVLQNDAIIDSYPGYSDEWRQTNKDFLLLLFRWVYEIPLSQSLAEPLRERFMEWTSMQNDTVLQMTGLKDREEMYLARYLRTADTQWYRRLMHYDPAEYIPRVHVPVLLLNGDCDILVPAEPNLSTADSLLHVGGNTRFEKVILPGLNHMFQHCETCRQEEIPDLSDVFAEEALEEIYRFLKQYVL